MVDATHSTPPPPPRVAAAASAPSVSASTLDVDDDDDADRARTTARARSTRRVTARADVDARVIVIELEHIIARIGPTPPPFVPTRVDDDDAHRARARTPTASTPARPAPRVADSRATPAPTRAHPLTHPPDCPITTHV